MIVPWSDEDRALAAEYLPGGRFHSGSRVADDPDTTVVDVPTRHTIIGLPPPARLPAEAPGAKYRRLYPPALDNPLEVVIHWGNGIDWSAR